MKQRIAILSFVILSALLASPVQSGYYPPSLPEIYAEPLDTLGGLLRRIDRWFGSQNVTLQIAIPLKVGEPVIVLPTITLNFSGGGSLDCESQSGILTIQGRIVASPGQRIFVNSNSNNEISFAGNVSLKEISADWWGTTSTFMNPAIGAAATAPNGMRVSLLAHTYLIGTPLIAYSNVALEGAGSSTVLSLVNNVAVISIGAVSNIHLAHFRIIGNRTLYTGSGNDGIRATVGGASGIIIEDLDISGMGGNGILLLATAGAPSADITIRGCQVNDVGASGIQLQDYINRAQIVENKVSNWGMTFADRIGIVASRSGTDIVIAHNIITGNGAALGASVHGISVDTTRRVSVLGNIISGTIGYGIEVGFSRDVAVTGNVVSDAHRAGIGVSGSGDLVSVSVALVGNILRSGAAQGVYIFVAAPTAVHANINVQGNTIMGSGTYGIQADNVDALLFEGNIIKDSGTAGLTFGANVTNPTVRSNVGWATENANVGTIASGTTSIAITHGLSVTPATKDIVITPTNNPTNDPGNFWISNLTSTQFTVNVRNDPGSGGATFAWQAIVH